MNDRRSALLGALRVVGWGVLATGVIVLGFVPYALFATNSASRQAQSELGRSIGALHLARSSSGTSGSVTAGHPATSGQPSGQRAGGSSPGTARPRGGTSGLDSVPSISWPTRVALGTPLAQLTIAAAGVEDDVVVQGTDELRLEEGPGHYTGTPLPGEPGNVAIAGHRTTWLRPFYNLQALRRGDPIVVQVGQLRYIYGVVDVTAVVPGDAGVIGKRRGWWLTLTTCTPRYSAAQRLVVHARLEVTATLRADAPAGTTQPAPGGGPSQQSGASSQHSGGHDVAQSYRVTQLPSAAAVLPAVPRGVLVAWCVAVATLLVACGLIARRHRLALLLLAPAAACCFEAYGAAARLLPASW